MTGINRNRGVVRTARAELLLYLKKFLRKQAPHIAQQAADALVRFTKDDDETLNHVLNDLDLEGWAVIASDGDMRDILRRVAKDGAARAVAQVGIDDADITDQLNEFADKYAKERAAEMVGKRWVGEHLIDNPNAEWRIDEGTRELLRGTVSEAITEGWSTDKLMREIERSTAFSESRSDMIARTEVAFADSAGNMKGYRESGVVVGKEWVPSEDACDICLENADAGVIGLDEPFPSGDDTSPAHPHCICDVAPVTQSMADDSADNQ